MKSSKPTGSFAPPEVQRFILPMTLSSIALMTGLIMQDVLFNPRIDLAERRLYIAQERGRNQIEPDIHHWENLQ
jgi:hypothetical protein